MKFFLQWWDKIEERWYAWWNEKDEFTYFTDEGDEYEASSANGEFVIFILCSCSMLFGLFILYKLFGPL